VRLLKLVNTLLDFSRIEAGRVQASFEPVDLVAFTSELASNFRSTIERAGLRLLVGTAALPQPVYVDHDMWEKVILNLLSNAFKYTFDGEIAVEFRVSSDAGSAEVTIRDSGTGIPADELPHLFERFRRIENASGRSIEGSGIGLALVQELVKLHGGDIRVVSEPGRGSAFTVAIPFGTAHLPPERIGRPRTSTVSNVRAQAYLDEARAWLSDTTTDAADLPAASGSEDIGDVMPVAGAERYRVVLADDNLDMRNYVERLLRSAGYQVDAVADGAAALDAARQRRPDLVLSDIMMPKLDGFGLLAALREDPELRPTPVLLLSARAGDEAKVEGLSAGADDYLTKPFSARELLARVRANIDLAVLRREAVRVERELRHQAELAQERAESVLASINDGFMAINAAWCFTYVNPAAERMIGRAGEALIGKNLWAEYPAGVRNSIEANYRRAMTERVDIAFETFYAPWRRWLDIRIYPTRDSGITVYFQDVSERKQAEEIMRRANETLEVQVALRTSELQAKEARLRTIFETSFTFQGLMALDGTLLDANAASLAAIDARFEDVVNKPFWDTPWFTGTPGMPEMVREAVPTVAAGDVVRQELYINLPVGGWRWFDFQMRPVRNGQGAVVGIVPEAVEVTARRQVEEALRQAQKMEGIGQLTGGVAHDFNNLLTIIAGNLETIQRQLKSPSFDVGNLQRLAGNATRGAERAISLTQRLLAFSRQQPLDAKPVAIDRLITGMSELLRRSIGEQIAVETVIAGGLWQINTDAHHLEIAILNLVLNARDAMPNGGRITIEAANASLDESYAFANTEVAPGQYVMLAITDNGIGMAPETIARAFEPFFTTKDVGHGTGLGLSQVYGFVKQSGGHVKIYSEVGDGTTVKIYLPRLHAHEAAALEEPVERVMAGSRYETILLVEDDDAVRAHTGGILRELGYDVLEAAHGKAALDLLDRQPGVRLLFTDVGLPGGMNGRQLADAARQRRPNLKVLFTTGYARNAIVHDGRLDPGVQLITKPFTYVALSAKLRDVLDARTAAPSILLVEDDELIQMVTSDDLQELGFRVQTAGSAAEAKEKLRLLDGDVDAAIVDVELPDASGETLVTELRSIHPKLPIVVASGHDQATLRSRFNTQDLLGFLGKPYGIEQLRAALRALGV
jgi:PAS domain S-box-containing protein